MKTKLFLYLLPASLLFTTCKKAPETDGRFFAFGYACGFCSGDGAKFYLLKNGHLYNDNMDRYTGNDWTFKSGKLSREQYKLAKDLKASFPDFLEDSPSATFGMPDARDQGAYHVQIGTYKTVKTFHIDTDVSKQPEEIRDFVKKLGAVIDELEAKN